MSRLRTLVPLVLAFSFVALFLVAPAFAQSAAPVAPSSWQQIVNDYVIPSVEALLAGLVSVLIPYTVAWVNRHLAAKGMAISAGRAAQLQAWAQKAVAFAEERGAAIAAAKLGAADPTKGNAKLQMATEFVLNAAQTAGVKAPTTEQAQAAIHSVLGSLPGVGASGNTAVAVPAAPAAA